MGADVEAVPGDCYCPTVFLSGLIVTVAVAVGSIGRSRCLARREKLDAQAKARDS